MSCRCVCLVIISVLIYSCAAAPKKVEIEKTQEVEPSTVEIEKEPVHKEEEVKSLELFTEVLDLVESADDRKAVLPQIEELYKKIIEQYPQAPLAQESYWKLITIYVEDYSPPAYDRAESAYYEFVEKYPKSFMKGFIEDAIGNSYYKNKNWERLLKLTSPMYREYLDSGNPPRASIMFMYAEAQYNLGNTSEAVKGYEITEKLFPKLIVGIKSRKMIETIESNKD
jgi:tetratricopeptide (TPR) repeat protein